MDGKSWAISGILINGTIIPTQKKSIILNNEEMTKEDALKVLEFGHKITHRLFVDGEYLYRKDDTTYTEDGFPVMDEFWEIRDTPIWETDWCIL